jgi:pimeloyl-ACP methyl ester carboxylesterase
MSTHHLDRGDAVIAYDVRPADGPDERPPLVMIGQPMTAEGFATLAGLLHERTVVTYDPRGLGRSTRSDGLVTNDPATHVADLHALVGELGPGPVDVFASSGGAVNALALVAKYPDDVRTLVAHEPPLASVLPDREHALAACRAIRETYLRAGGNAAMAHFIAVVSHQGEFTAEVAAQPAPDPAMFGMSTDDDGDRSDVMLAQTILTIPGYEPDFDALRAAPTRIVMAAGEDEPGTMASRGAHVVAERLGTPLVDFPGGHGGFLGGEYGQTGKPDEFATKLRDVLDA